MPSLQREHLRTLCEPATSQYSKLMTAEVHLKKIFKLSTEIYLYDALNSLTKVILIQSII